MRENDPEDSELWDEFGDLEETEPTKKSILHRKLNRDSLWPVFWFIAISYGMSFLYWNNELRSLLWVSQKAIIHDGEYWRLFSAVFVHSGMKHFLSNLPLLIIFGWLLYDYFGAITFPISALILGALSNLATVWFYPPDIRLVGASGMIHSMVSLWIVFYIRYDITRPLRTRFFRAFGFVLVMLIPSAVYPRTSYLAHGTGFILGLLWGVIMICYFNNNEEFTRNKDKKARLH